MLGHSLPHFSSTTSATACFLQCLLARHSRQLTSNLNPDTATFADLEQCEARLRCLKCAEVGVQEYAYTWEAAFALTAEHNTTYANNAYPKSSHNRWSRVGKGDMVRVKQLEAVSHALTVDSNCQLPCALCVDGPGTGGKGKWRVREHLASKHNIVDMNGVVEDGTIFWSLLRNVNKVMKPAVKL